MRKTYLFFGLREPLAGWRAVLCAAGAEPAAPEFVDDHWYFEVTLSRTHRDAVRKDWQVEFTAMIHGVRKERLKPEEWAE